jgi:ketosteroid isomerase-like protein
MSTANLQVVFDHLDARRRRDIERLAANLDPAVVHQGVQPDLVCNGRDEVLVQVRSSFARDDFGVERLEIIDAGERVVLGLAGERFREVQHLRRGQIFIVFTLRDGKITRMDDFLTREQALRAAGAQVGDWL